VFFWSQALGAATMLKIGPSGVRVASQFIGLLLVAPGFYIGFLGITDMAPSSPRGVAGFAELFGYLFWVWAVFFFDQHT